MDFGAGEKQGIKTSYQIKSTCCGQKEETLRDHQLGQ
jgi:hypothetical protein